ncbi:MAG: replicative DNA helicase [Pseudomonadales bacterium]|jgi:replicative DNA helicase|uniref:Replicative DNA helicase n=1 Tax=Umboniibacter marinipuniceus TaxID=569599 RepID=A0A3M0AFE6_9GAMM|nr:replicative DNA helicase [Umboniibacter marinipuniceus]RMA82319.1 replicative DNA helicase [Umboniibacter marinipuniceus]
MEDYEVEAPLTERPSLPHSEEAEVAVIGGLMIENGHLDNVMEVVTEDDFFIDRHRLIFSAMQSLHERSQPFDVITLSESLDARDELGRAGGLVYLSEMAESTPSTSNIMAYANIVRERATVRQLITAANEISRTSLAPAGMDSDSLLQLAERKVADIAENRPKQGGWLDAKELLDKSVEKITELFESEDGLTGLSTGWDSLDDMTSGWQEQDLVIIAARPSMGKTTLAMNTVEKAALSQSQPVCVFSLEMPAEQLMMRMLASVGRIDQTRIRTGQLEHDDWPKLTAAIEQLRDTKLFIDDTPGLSPADIRARLRRIEREHGKVAMVMVDYLQLMRISGFSEGRTQEISEISRSLKAIAREFKCPMLALSQLNRSLEQRPNKRPVNSDLRESGAIEQDADIIMFIYRDEVYNEDSPDRGVAELIIGKQRNGPIGTTRVAFVGKLSRFENLSPDQYGGDYDE